MKTYISNMIIISIDLLALTVLFYITAFFFPHSEEIALGDFLFIMFIIFILFVYEKIYTLHYDFWQETYKILKSLVLAFFLVMAILALLKTSFAYSKIFITTYFFLGLFLLPVVKRLEKRVLYSFDCFKKNVLLLGNTVQIRTLKKEFQKNWYLGMKTNKRFYDIVIIPSKGMNPQEMDNTITKYLNEKSAVYVVPYVTSIDFANSVIMDYTNVRVNTIRIENKLLLKQNVYIKYIFDYLLAFAVLPIFLSVHFFVALAVLLESKGKIFFKQERLGKNNKIFKCYKYRTMYENSDALLQQYLTEHPEEIAYYEKYHKYKNDPRITKVGKFLRSSSLDELPQVLNVLQGEMSFVGPRPYMLSEAEKLGKLRELILKVKPGITGLWQVSGRNNLTFRQRSELEVWYIKNWSLWADLVILVKTVKVVLAKVGAK
ncbi:exopolysaccharide biosynthesis polyprenyl glycosylphosphotransferase [Sulfurimonas sp. NWX367]|uniref:exopolysaccharide biosynthesis polyprenyl glycosylphosphotransferase n=1 Tax=unclassified Sulfurimonas TaxID=2623549 RepID=UPI003204F44F